jgi:hypothetical protein
LFNIAGHTIDKQEGFSPTPLMYHAHPYTPTSGATAFPHSQHHSYVNFPFAPDAGAHKSKSSPHVMNLNEGDRPLPNKSPSYLNQISCEESLRLTEGGVDFIEKSRQQEASVAKQKQWIIELQAKVGAMEKRLAEKTEEIAAQKERIQNQEELINSFEGRNCNGVYIWKIKEFTRLRSEAIRGEKTVLHSPGFYTSYYGYKLCIRVNLNGVEGGNGSHISVFIHFMKGDFDDILEWPFRGKIILTIINQCDPVHNITEVLESKPNLAAFQRPQSNRNHKGFGYIEFAQVTVIESGKFVVNDTLILKADVKSDMDSV